jgi:hypothetical protein
VRPVSVAASKTPSASKGSKNSGSSASKTVRDPETTQQLRIAAVVLA